MAFVPWKDRVTATPHRYRLTEVAPDTYDLTAVPGAISEAGTPVNATNLNRLIQRDGDDIKDTVVAFTEAGARANISTGESTATLFGKVKKYFTDLKAHAFTAPSTTQGTSTTTVPSDKLLRESSFARVYRSFTDLGIPNSSTIAELHSAMIDNSRALIAVSTYDHPIYGNTGLELPNNYFYILEAIRRDSERLTLKLVGKASNSAVLYQYEGMYWDNGVSNKFTGWKRVIDDSSAQTISAIKTYSVSPLVPTTPSGPSAAVSKAYADLKVAKAGDETITGVKTFATGATPLITDQPTTDLMAVNKLYVDSKVSATNISYFTTKEQVKEVVPNWVYNAWTFTTLLNNIRTAGHPRSVVCLYFDGINAYLDNYEGRECYLTAFITEESLNRRVEIFLPKTANSLARKDLYIGDNNNGFVYQQSIFVPELNYTRGNIGITTLSSGVYELRLDAKDSSNSYYFTIEVHSSKTTFGSQSGVSAYDAKINCSSYNGKINFYLDNGTSPEEYKASGYFHYRKIKDLYGSNQSGKVLDWIPVA